MQLQLDRVFEKRGATFGFLSWGNKVVCTLEDAFQERKIPGETRIPAGEYEIKFRKESPMATRYRQRFGDDHIGMLWLQDVPNFEWIYIHVGNTADDTDGCILVGTSMTPAAGKVGNSVTAYEHVYPAVAQALLRDERVTIQINDSVVNV